MLKHPLTKKAIHETFAAPLAVAIDAINTHKTGDGIEAEVSGSWSFSKLEKTFKALGFKKVGGKDSGAFVNEDSTVGLVCQGVEPDPKSNRWKSFSFEILSRSRASVKRQQKYRLQLF